MNRNTIEELINEKNEKLKNSFDAVERATLDDEIKELQKQLKQLDGKKRKEPKLTTNVNAPIIGDRKEAPRSARGGQIINNSGSTYISMI